MSNGQIRYTITAEDRMSDVVSKVRGNFGQLKDGVSRIAGEFRQNGWGAGVKALGDMRIQSLGAVPGMRMLLGLINPATMALGAMAVAGKLATLAMAQLRVAVREAVNFQTATFDLAPLVGGVRQARQVMLQLTEGKEAVDHVFGQDAVKRAYRDLHTYSDGALATARNVRILGENARRTGMDLGQVSQQVGQVWQRIVGGQEMQSLRRVFQSMRLDPNLVNELERMREAGASAGELWSRFWAELEKAKGTIQATSGSIDDLNKRIADAKGTIATTLGEFFTPLVTGWKKAQLAILEGMAKLTRREIVLALRVTGRGKLAALLDMLPGGGRRAADTDSDETDAAGAADAAAARNAGDTGGQADAALRASWSEVRQREAERREAERVAGMGSGELFAEAADAERSGRAGDYERLRIAAEKRQIEEAANAAAATAKQTAAAEEAARRVEEDTMAEARLREQLRLRMEEDALAEMTPEDRAEELRRRAIGAQDTADFLGGEANPSAAAARQAAEARIEQYDYERREKAERARIAADAERAREAAEAEAARQAEASQSQRRSLLEQAAGARGQIAGMQGIQRAGISVAERADWMRDVSAGRSPDEMIVENTRRMADLLDKIAKAEGVQ